MPRTHAAVVELLTNALVLPALAVVPQAERSNCNQRGVRQVQGQRLINRLVILLAKRLRSPRQSSAIRPSICSPSAGADLAPRLVPSLGCLKRFFPCLYEPAV